MRVFVDANFLVAMLNREYPLFNWSARILCLHGKRNIQLFTSPLCLAIAFHFATKKAEKLQQKKKIEILCQNIGNTTVNQEIIEMTLSNQKIKDFEDGLQYYSALYIKCDCIITEDQHDFYFHRN